VKKTGWKAVSGLGVQRPGGRKTCEGKRTRARTGGGKLGDPTSFKETAGMSNARCGILPQKNQGIKTLNSKTWHCFKPNLRGRAYAAINRVSCAYGEEKPQPNKRGKGVYNAAKKNADKVRGGVMGQEAR